MNWLTPFTGAILALSVIPPLVILYFLKLRRRGQAIASTLLWQRAIEDLRANAPFQRLRQSLLLWLQLLALMLLILSVMQPQIQAGRRAGGKTILLIDNSASMNTVDGEDGESRLAQAKTRAKERIEAIYAGGLLAKSPGQTMIVTFADRAEIACRFSGARRELLAAIDRIRPSDGETSLADALKLARAYTTNVDPDSDRPQGEASTIELFSDGKIADLPEQVIKPGRETLVFHPIGTDTTDNIGIVAISVERPYDRPTAVEVFSAVVNHSLEVVTCDIQLSVDTNTIAVQEVRLPAAKKDERSGEVVPGRGSIVFTPFEQPRDVIIEVAITRADALTVDNTAYVVVPPPRRLRAAVVPATSYFAREVLEGMALESLELLRPADYVRLAEDGGLGRFDVIVFDNYAPPEGAMPPGRYLTLGPTPPVEGLNPFGTEDAQIVLRAGDHPIMRFVNLENLLVTQSTLLQPADDVQILVEGSAGPLVVAVSRGPMELIHVAFDPGNSNWPLLRSWVTFLFNVIEHLGQIGEGLTVKGAQVGDAISTRVPAAARDVLLRSPNGDAFALTPLDDRTVAWGPIRRTGLYRIEWEDPDATAQTRSSRAFAVNLLDEAEGSIAVREQIEVGRDQVSGTAAEGAAYTALWPYAIGLCLFVLMLEWWVYHRKTWV